MSLILNLFVLLTHPVTNIIESNQGAWYAYLKDIIILIVALTGAITAVLGLKTWRRQLKGNTEYDLARRLLKSVYRVRDEFKIVRNIWASGGEIDKALKEQGLEVVASDPKYNTKTSRALYSARWNKFNICLSDMNINRLEAEVIWGDKIREAMAKYDQCIKDLNISIQLYLLEMEGSSGLDEKERKKHFLIVYDTSSDPAKNEFSGRIQQAVQEIEEFIKPKLKI